ncbi:hypothetical protein BDW59DRAFT_167716 [Aspergillus cavernicola]|uniref:LysM domain-containing protein n=1 Tax=Aspergillus cavernicola TaxID=176166 RepID=A0ABR4HC40_9EURO
MRLPPSSVIALLTALSLFTAADAVRERAQRCPISCDSSMPSQWTSYHDPAYLSVCNETMLMYLAIYNPLDDPSTHSTIFACSTAKTSLVWIESEAQSDCRTDFNDSSATIEFGWSGSADESVIDQTLAIGDAIQRYFSNSVNCGHKDLFARAGQVIVGIHIGSNLEHSSAPVAAIQQLTSSIKSANGVYDQTVLQVCGSDSERTLGVSVNTQGSLTSVQKHMRTWNDGKCVDNLVSKEITDISLRTASRVIDSSTIGNTTALQARSMSIHHGHHHHHNRASHTYHRRSTCSYVQVASGDSCASLVQECGITAAEFTNYNPASDLCSALAVGQYVCCSEGDLPDFSPKPYSNGTFYTYAVQSGNSCSALEMLQREPTGALTVVDYIIYMTYNLHGQWDYGSTWAQDGCPAGNFLRSHVNLTETMLSLAMITKAGVATKQVVVGVTSYGRGFEMTDADCTGPMCTFTGPDSGATPSRCTNTAGYIANAEIDLLISDNNSTQVLFDGDTDSDLIIYDSVQWVAYMTNTAKSTRTEYYQSLNMAGTSEWAIDLESFGSSDDDSMTEWDPCTSMYDTLDAIEANASNIPDYCMNTYIVGVQHATLNESLANYTDIINDGYDDKFDAYSGYITELIPEELKLYMAANASRYFTCKTETYIQCCKDCSNAYACSNGCSSDSDCVTGYANVTSDCPDTIPEPDTLAARETQTPAHLISSSLTNLTIINDMLVDAYTNMYIDIWTANESAAVDSATLPTSMTKYAVQSMAKVAAEGAAIEAAEKKEMILSFVLGILFLLPSLGEAIDAAELATQGRVISLAGDAGNIRASIHGIVEDPKSAVFAVFGLLVAGRSDPEDAMENAKVAWREVSTNNIAKLGSDVKAEVDKVDSLKVSCI